MSYSFLESSMNIGINSNHHGVSLIKMASELCRLLLHVTGLGTLVIERFHQFGWRLHQLGLKRQPGLLLHLLLASRVHRVLGAASGISRAHSSEVIDCVVALPLVIFTRIQSVLLTIEVNRGSLCMRSSSKV